MNKKLLRLYQKLPYPLKVIGASVHGARLYKLRYGPNFDRLVEKTIERETWSKNKREEWSQERTEDILNQAAKKVPYYRNLWSRRRQRGDRRSWNYLEHWPVLRKAEVKLNPQAFIADDVSLKSLYYEHTSGTTGTPVSLWFDKKAIRKWYALNEVRVRNWNGVSKRDRWAILGGQLVTPFEQTKPPFWVWNAGMQQLYMSSYHIATDYIQDYLSAIKYYKIKFILGYPSAISGIAKIAQENKFDAPNLDVVISNAETLLDHQREIISEVFQCRVVDTYGMAEVVAAASECQYGTLHQWPEVGLWEILEQGAERPIDLGQRGRLICTGLLNFSMPLIRYEVGDWGALSRKKECPCGRTLPVVASIEGRLDDIILTPDGRQIGRLDPIFKADLPIREAQIIQKSREKILVLIVPDRNFSEQDKEEIAGRLRERIGKIEILTKIVHEIPRNSNGKFRSVVSEVI